MTGLAARPRPTLRDVASRAGVSIATVSLVLRGLAADRIGNATRERVRDAARDLRYRHNALAASLRTGTSDVVAFLVGRLDTPQLATKVGAAESLLREHGRRTVIWHTSGQADVEAQALKDIGGQMIAGLLVTHPVGPGGAEQLRELIEAGVCVVALEPIERVDAHIVTVDRAAAMRLATEHLLELGHRDIGLIGPACFIDTEAGYGRGYAEALGGRGLTVQREMVHELPLGEPPPGGLFEAGHEVGRRILEGVRTPTAVVCADDEVAVGLMRAASDSGLAVPDDLAIVGFDDLPVAAYAPVPLTTVSHPTREAGYRAAQVLLAHLEDKVSCESQQVMLEPELVVRESCGATAPGRGR